MISCSSSSSWRLSAKLSLPSIVRSASARACNCCHVWHCQQVAQEGDDQLQQQHLLAAQCPGTPS